MGSQTGVSLYAPSTGASLVTLRGTDGIASGAGVMPLTWLQDFAGPMARTTSDIARILNATTGTDPDDLFTLHNNAGEKRPADYKTALDKQRAAGQADRLPAGVVHRQPELRPGRRHDRSGHRPLRRHRGRGRDDGGADDAAAERSRHAAR